MVEREATDQLGIQGLGHADCRGDLAVEVFVEGDEDVVRAVFGIEQLDLADPGPDPRHAHAELLMELVQPGQFGVIEFDDVFHLPGPLHVDEPGAVVFQANGSHDRELFDRGLVVGGFVGKRAKNHAGSIAHGAPRQTACLSGSADYSPPSGGHCRNRRSGTQDTTLGNTTPQHTAAHRSTPLHTAVAGC